MLEFLPSTYEALGWVLTQYKLAVMPSMKVVEAGLGIDKERGNGQQANC